jgi:hypothetical protein
MRLFFVVFLAATFTFSCKSKEILTNEESAIEKSADRPIKGDRKAPPSVDEVFKMDSNNDARLSLSEVADSPLSKRFDVIDANSDGFITKEEFANAPKPPKGQRRTKNN